MENEKYSKGIFYILFFSGIVLSIAVLKIASSFFIPLTVALLLSFAFYPFIKKLADFHVPWIIGIIIVVIIATTVFFFVGNLLFASCKAILEAYPKYESRFTVVYSLIAQAMKLPFDENSSLMENLWNSLGVRTFVQNLTLAASNYMLSIVKVITVILLLMIFFLIETCGLKKKVQAAFPEERLNRKIMFIITKTIAEVTQYISIKFFVSLLTGGIVFIITASVGLDFAIIWGFIAFILNFIPNFGSMVSWGLTTAFAVLQFYPSMNKIVPIAISVLAANFIFGNIIEPRWAGSDLGISPFFILVALSLFGWVWGFIGMILAVPILVTIKIICENIEMLKPAATLLGSKTKFKNRKRHFLGIQTFRKK